MSLLQAIERRLPAGYRLQERIGSGATALVYVARHESDAAPSLVVKALHAGRARTADAARFARETRILRTLDHPRIVSLLTEDEAAGVPFFTMPCLPGATLDRLLRERGPLPLRLALSVARDVAEALGHVHGHGIVHRDVKPANVLVGEDGRAFLLDFGLASAPALTPDGAPAADAGLAIGTPEYISPEQVAGRRAGDSRGDLFSLACVLQEMLTGRPPFTGGPPRAVMQRRLTEPPEALRAARPEVPDAVVAIVLRNLAVSPNDRFATTGQLRMALDAALAGLDATPGALPAPAAA